MRKLILGATIAFAPLLLFKLLAFVFRFESEWISVIILADSALVSYELTRANGRALMWAAQTGREKAVFIASVFILLVFVGLPTQLKFSFSSRMTFLLLGALLMIAMSWPSNSKRGL